MRKDCKSPSSPTSVGTAWGEITGCVFSTWQGSISSPRSHEAPIHLPRFSCPPPPLASPSPSPSNLFLTGLAKVLLALAVL